MDDDSCSKEGRGFESRCCLLNGHLDIFSHWFVVKYFFKWINPGLFFVYFRSIRGWPVFFNPPFPHQVLSAPLLDHCFEVLSFCTRFFHKENIDQNLVATPHVTRLGGFTLFEWLLKPFGQFEGEKWLKYSPKCWTFFELATLFAPNMDDFLPKLSGHTAAPTWHYPLRKMKKIINKSFSENDDKLFESCRLQMWPRC